jgi:outer membrane protein assembly factor BamB
VLHACEVASGVERWRVETTGQILAGPTPDGGHVIVGSYDGHLYCVRATDGAQIWRYDVGERVHGSAAVTDGHVLVAACDAQLHVVDRNTGQCVRRVPLGAVCGAGPATVGREAYLGTYGEEVVAVDWQSGAVTWRFRDADRSFPYLSSAALTAELVLVAGRDKRLRALERDRGRQRWEFVTRGRMDGSPVVVGERVYFGSGDGVLYALDVQTGREHWRYETGGAIYASPSVAAGCLVIGNESGLLLCCGAAR